MSTTDWPRTHAITGHGYPDAACTCRVCDAVGSELQALRALRYENRHLHENADEYMAARAEVERLKKEIAEWHLCTECGCAVKHGSDCDGCGHLARAEKAEAEVERLRGLILGVESTDGRCPWCDSDGGDVDGDWHYADCSAFSARGEVRR